MPKSSKSQASPSPNHRPLISVIIPVYNVESTLERCLNSVMKQTYQNLEILLINDGSTDRSGELCDQLARKDSRIKVIHQKNQGLSAARNTGLSLMRGSHVTFVDSDDFLDHTMIEKLYQSLFITQLGQDSTSESQNLTPHPQASPLKLSICSFAEVFPDGSERSFVRSLAGNPATNPQSSSAPQPHLLDQANCLIDMLCERDFTLMACGKLYAAELFETVRYPVGKLYEDVGTTYRLILQCDQVAFLPEPLYKYYQNPSSIIHQTFRPAKLDLIDLTDQMCDNIAIFYHITSQSQNPQITTDWELNPTSQSKNPKNTTDWEYSTPEKPQNSAKNPEDLKLSTQNSTESFKTLENALKLRRMHARFSILRQIIFAKPETPEQKSNFRKIRRETVTYLKSHQADILKNPLRTKRDLLAMQSLRLGLPVFTLAWRLYAHFRS